MRTHDPGQQQRASTVKYHTHVPTVPRSAAEIEGRGQRQGVTREKEQNIVGGGAEKPGTPTNYYPQVSIPLGSRRRSSYGNAEQSF